MYHLTKLTKHATSMSLTTNLQILSSDRSFNYECSLIHLHQDSAASLRACASERWGSNWLTETGSQAIMTENQLQIPAFKGYTADFCRRETGNGLCRCLLHQLLIQSRVDAPCKCSCKLDQPCPHILLQRSECNMRVGQKLSSDFIIRREQACVQRDINYFRLVCNCFIAIFSLSQRSFLLGVKLPKHVSKALQPKL